MLKRWFLFSLPGLVLAGFLYRRATPSDRSPELAPPVADAGGVVSVGALRLWRDYEANEVAADNRYKGKKLRVAGRVASVEKNAIGQPVVHLVSGNPVFLTMATLDSAQTQSAAALVRGQQVVVQCVGAGRMLRMALLESCAILPQK
jgi:hypothetical protein